MVKIKDNKTNYLTPKEMGMSREDVDLQICLGIQSCKSKGEVLELLSDVRKHEQSLHPTVEHNTQIYETEIVIGLGDFVKVYEAQTDPKVISLKDFIGAFVLMFLRDEMYLVIDTFNKHFVKDKGDGQ